MSKSDWNTSEERFLVCIREGRGVVQKEGHASDVFVEAKESDEKSKTLVETKTMKKEMNPVWNQLLFVTPCPSSMMFRCWASVPIGRDFIGQVSLNTELKNSPEIVKDEWFNLGNRDKDLKKDKVKERHGELHLSWVSSSHPINRSLLSVDYKYHIWVHQYARKFETGDVLFFSGTGLLDNAIKVATGSNYTSIGFVLKKHNKWTNQPELYLVECANAGSAFTDVSSDTARSGVVVYKLLERVHAFHGDAIWWGRNSSSPSNDAIRTATEFLADVVEKRPLLDYKEKPERKPSKDEEEIFTTPAVLESLVSFLSSHNVDVKKDPSLAYQLYSPQLIAKTLLRMGSGWNCNFETVGIADIANLELYKHTLTLIRANDGSKDAYLAKQVKSEAGKEFKAGKGTSNFGSKLPSEASFSNQQTQIDMFHAMINWKAGQPMPSVLSEEKKVKKSRSKSLKGKDDEKDKPSKDKKPKEGKDKVKSRSDSKGDVKKKTK